MGYSTPLMVRITHHASTLIFLAKFTYIGQHSTVEPRLSGHLVPEGGWISEYAR